MNQRLLTPGGPLAYARPSEARGIVPLIMAGLSVAGGIAKAIQGNQRKQRNKGYIEAAYRQALAREKTHQSDVLQGQRESNTARGLGAVGRIGRSDAISQAMGGTLGDRNINESVKGLQLEHQDLEGAHTQAVNENKADYINTLVGAVGSGIGGALNAYAGSQVPEIPGEDGQAGSYVPYAGEPGQAVASSSISGAMLSGVDAPGNAFGDINPVDPLGSGAWHTEVGGGQPNYNFRLG